MMKVSKIKKKHLPPHICGFYERFGIHEPLKTTLNDIFQICIAENWTSKKFFLGQRGSCIKFCNM